MRSFAALVVLLVTCMTSLATPAPKIEVKEAIATSEAYVLTSKKIASLFYVSSAVLATEADGRLTWRIRYDLKDAGPRKGGWFVITVEMDRTCSMTHGK